MHSLQTFTVYGPSTCSKHALVSGESPLHRPMDTLSGSHRRAALWLWHSCATMCSSLLQGPALHYSARRVPDTQRCLETSCPLSLHAQPRRSMQRVLHDAGPSSSRGLLASCARTGHVYCAPLRVQ